MEEDDGSSGGHSPFLPQFALDWGDGTIDAFRPDMDLISLYRGYSGTRKDAKLPTTARNLCKLQMFLVRFNWYFDARSSSCCMGIIV